MSRCTICNVIMSEAELKHKDSLTGQYTDMCFDCQSEHEAYDDEDTSDTVAMLYKDNSYKVFDGEDLTGLVDVEYNDN